MAAIDCATPCLPRLPGLRALAAGIALTAFPAFVQANDEPQLRVVRHEVINGDASAIAGAVPTYRLSLSIAVMIGTGWRTDEVLDAAKRAAGILSQCPIRTSMELHEFDGPKRYRSLFTPVSRELTKRLSLPKPTIFFVADTLNRPAFDAEAVGRGNSRSRPEMADTVWIASGARDLPIVIAHELAHVLADSGAHSDQAGNLMRDETRENGTRLTAAQCDAIVTTASANGLLRPLQ